MLLCFGYPLVAAAGYVSRSYNVVMKSVYFCMLALLATVCCLPLTASAQWEWTDKDGRKVFSDQGPPSDIPDKNIRRRSGPLQSGTSSATSPGAAASAASAPRAAIMGESGDSGGKPMGVDNELEQKVRKAEEAEKAARLANEQKTAKVRADNCSRAMQGKIIFESGVRVARLNAQGEREFVDGAARATEMRRLQSVIESDCR